MNPMENEAVIDWALKNLDLEIISIEEDFGLKRSEPLTAWQGIKFHPEVKKAFKISPVDNPTEGFFIARFKKKSVSKESSKIELTANEYPGKKVLDHLFTEYGIVPESFAGYAFSGNDSKLWILSGEWEGGVLPFAVRTGLKLAQRRQYGQWRLTPAGAQSFGNLAGNKRLPVSDSTWGKLLERNRIPVEKEDGYYLLFYGERCVTYGQVEHGKLRIKLGRPFLLEF
jgi:hypothetical protein